MAVTLAELREARGIVAELLIENPAYQSVFEEMDSAYQRMTADKNETAAQAEARRRREIRELT